MKKSRIFLVISSLLLVSAILFTLTPPKRYGIHADTKPCGKNAEHQVFYTATGYLISTQSLNKNVVSIGTCPYQNFNAKTYALEFWIPGIVLAYTGIEKQRRAKRFN